MMKEQAGETAAAAQVIGVGTYTAGQKFGDIWFKITSALLVYNTLIY